MILVLSFVQVVFQSLAEEEPEKYQQQFSQYIKKGTGADDTEAPYKKVHAAIRADPSMTKLTKKSLKDAQEVQAYEADLSAEEGQSG